MKTPVLVVVNMDNDYLIPLEMKLAFMVGDRVDLNFISCYEAFKEFFAVSRNIDILLIYGKFYSPELQKHVIKKTFILAETEEEQRYMEIQHGETAIFKYTNLNILISMFLPDEWRYENEEEAKGKILAVLSPSGGSGCTTVSIALARFLADRKQKVLYLNSQPLQNFQYYCENRTSIALSNCLELGHGDNIYNIARKYIVHELYDFFPELPASPQSMGMDGDMIHQMALQAANSKEYHFVIIDVGTDISSMTLEILNNAERVLVVVNQDSYSEYKINALNRILNYSDAGRFMFVCNKFDVNIPNVFAEIAGKERTNKVMINEYIEVVNQPLDIHTFSSVKGIQRIGMTLF